MKKIKTIVSLLLVVAMLFSFAACAKKEEAKKEEEKKVETIVLRASSPAGPDAAWTLAMQTMADEIEKTSNGRYHVDVYPNCSLSESNEKTLTQQVFSGTIDICIAPSSLASGEFAAFSVPFTFDDRAHIDRVYETQVVKEMVERLAAKGMTTLAFVENGYKQITNSKREIRVPADLKGIKIRTPQAASTQALGKLMGYDPTPLSAGELFLALQQGMCDGQENPVNTIYNNGYYEVQKYLTIIGYSWSNGVFAMNTDLYNSLSAEDQALFKTAFEHGAKACNDAMVAEEADYIKKLEEKGMQVYYCTEEDLVLWKEQLKDAWQISQASVDKETPGLMEAFRAAVASCRK